ncbi:acetylcholine receptor subunit beta-type lev-1-like [Ostrea edulis]|uniref:acetylcholine receptor subunit beta-type lev-1-like n=1 Tax=Ostrea edulis TaxID=37623 RepID=UPI0024AE8F34|nr:acetylcholine receptor subunit beta-type lev-1-like [Ostrea edulis]
MKPGKLLLIFLSTVCYAARAVRNNTTVCRSEEDVVVSVMKDYNRHVRPCLSLKEPMEINIVFSLMNINELDELTGKFSVMGFFYISWWDPRIQWEPKRYHNVRNIFLPQTLVWRPSIFLTNSFSKHRNLGNDEMIIHYTSSGHAAWNPGDVIETVCDVDVVNFPFDVQVCKLTYVTWGYSLTKMNFKLLFDKVNLKYFSPHGVWDVLETSAFAQSEHNMDYVHFVVKLGRRSRFFLINMLVPVLMLGLLNIFVFVIPVAHGDRIAYTLSVHLAIIVFLTLVSGNLPQTSKPNISLICYLLLANVFLSAFIIIFTIIGLRIHRKSTKEVPKCIKNFICTFRKVEETQNEKSEKHDITWKDAGKYFDRLCIFLFVSAFIFTNSTLLLKMSGSI